MTSYQDIREMYQGLPDPIQRQLEPPKPGGEAFNAFIQDGLSKIELVYHLIPGSDRRLDPPCTVQQVSTEFDICQDTARDTLEKLADEEILHRCKPNWQSYLISPHYWDAIGDSPEPTKLLRDGGIPTISDNPSPATTPTKEGTTPETGTLQYHLDDGSLDRQNNPPLVDSPDGELIAPVAASVALLTLGVPDGSLILTSGLALSVSWLAYQIAELPNYTPRDMIKKLTTEQGVFSLL